MSITYTLHVMWYEHQIVKEHFSSLRDALSLVDDTPINLIVCSNNQTYMEQPLDLDTLHTAYNIIKEELDSLSKMFPHLSVTLFEKTNQDELYNVGDFRREYRNDDGYICWGEIDCLLPTSYFYILKDLVQFIPQETFCVTFSSRKMWDSSWIPVEHDAFKFIDQKDVNSPYGCAEYITQEQLNEFNSREESAKVQQIFPLKVDGGLFAIYKNKFQILPEGLHFGKDDTIAATALQIYGVPQYHIQNVLKGHNYYHPNKRVNTDAQKHDSNYKKFYDESSKYGDAFIENLIKKYYSKQV